MNTATGLFLFAALLAPAIHAQAQKPFEGTITMSMVFPPDTGTHSAVLSLKGDKTEIDLDLGMQGLLKVYPQPENHKVFVAMMAMKSGQEMPMPGEDAAPPATLDLKPLKKKSTIAGHPVQAYLLKTDPVNFTLWETSDLPADVRLAYQTALPHLMQEDPIMKAALAKLAAKKLVPLKIDCAVKVMPDEKISFAFVKAESKMIDDAVFALPKDIKFSTPPQPVTTPDGSAPSDSTSGNGGLH